MQVQQLADLEAGAGPTARTLNGPVELKASLVVRTSSLVLLRAPCPMVAAVLYTQPYPITDLKGGELG